MIFVLMLKIEMMLPTAIMVLIISIRTFLINRLTRMVMTNMTAIRLNFIKMMMIRTIMMTSTRMLANKAVIWVMMMIMMATWMIFRC